jgi:hypothetical protein
VDVRASLLRMAARRPHVLLVPVPGGTTQQALEATLARRGWPVATGPADADVLAVAGSPGPELAAVIARIWRQVPAPRARIDVAAPAEVDTELDRAAAELASRDRQRAAGADPAEDGTVDGDDGGDGMTMPGGLPMADLGEDRDGLMLDRLHVPLGPVLPDWPAGLVLRVTLQGDVIQQATAEVLDAGRAAGSRPAGATVRELDALARFLGVAGWPAAAARARRLRDAVLAGASPAEVRAPADALLRRVRRSRTLRWLLRDAPVGAVDVARLLERRADAVQAALAGRDVQSDRPRVDDVPDLLLGAELAAARLILAALDPDVEVGQVARHG